MTTRKSSQQNKALVSAAALQKRLLASGLVSHPSSEAALEAFLRASEVLAAAEEELRQQEALSNARDAAELEQQRYKVLFELAPDGYVVTDLDGTIKMANHAFAAMLGLAPNNLMREPLTVYIASEERKFFGQQLFQLQRSDAPKRWETRLHPPHSTELDAIISVVRSFSPLRQEPELLWQLQDVTEIKQREQAEREQFFRATFEHSPVGMGHLGQQGEWLRVNEKLCQIFGYNADEIKQRSFIELTVPDDRAQTREFFRQTFSGEREMIRHEKPFLHHSGEVFWALINVTVVRSPSGEFLYNILVLEDITDRKVIEAAEREQRLIAETLRETALLLTSSLDFSEVIDKILLNIGRVVPHDAASFLLIKDESAYVARARGYGRYGASLESDLQDFHISADESDRIDQMLRTHNPVLIPEWKEHGTWDQVPGMVAMQSLAAVPILSRSSVIGFLKLHSRTSHFFTEEHAKLLQVFAAQAASAIHNARAYTEGQALAVLNERHRLARELHDAVTQTLFSANVIAGSLPRLWSDEIPDPVNKQLSQLQMLTRGALAEMRTLLLELRPEYLANIDLEAQLRQLLDAFQVRKHIDVELTVQVECMIPPSVRVACYRIAQEALNNVIKHAHATEVRVLLSARQDCVQLVVQDNGVGFEPHTKIAGFGLHTMTERANEIGAQLVIAAEPLSGTRIAVTWGSEAEE